MKNSQPSGPMAIFIPAWDEVNVIGRMLDHTGLLLAGQSVRIFVGCYPNDPKTIAEVDRAATTHAMIQRVLCPDPGPTTKADCLNALWRALKDAEAQEGETFKAVILHDAEDLVHSSELDLFNAMIGKHSLVQIPVVPLVDRKSRWVGGHYCDEFAEAHGKGLLVRDALGAGVPSAGVGCAIERGILGEIADRRGGQPFSADSLTEDYELGLRIAEYGGKGRFVRVVDDTDSLIAVRAHFPAKLGAATRQKTRWITGIALAGWDRLGWHGGVAERWMRLRDRRSILDAVILFTAYSALLLGFILTIIAATTTFELSSLSPFLLVLLNINLGLLLWRLAMRGIFTARTYGWREGLRAIPRAFISNIIAMVAARRAVTHYLSTPLGEQPVWDKTDHVFPEAADR